jgi:hypothetical protein
MTTAVEFPSLPVAPGPEFGPGPANVQSTAFVLAQVRRIPAIERGVTSRRAVDVSHSGDSRRDHGAPCGVTVRSWGSPSIFCPVHPEVTPREATTRKRIRFIRWLHRTSSAGSRAK